MIGHVYAKFSEEEEAADALNVMNGRYFDGRRMEVEFSPVTDFREASKWSSVVLYLWKLIVTMISRLFEQNCVDSIVTHMFSYCVNSCETFILLWGDQDAEISMRIRVDEVVFATLCTLSPYPSASYVIWKKMPRMNVDVTRMNDVVRRNAGVEGIERMVIVIVVEGGRGRGQGV